MKRYATDLGQALQHTNILRDLSGDAALGRIYVPGELLETHGVEPAWLEGRGPAEVYRPGGPMAAVAQAMALKAEGNSTSAPSPRSLTTRPPCSATQGFTTR